MKKHKELSDQHKIFAAQYIACDFNATKAAEAAGYSKKTARSQGQRLLTNVDIQKEIARRVGKAMKKVDRKAEEILDELTKIGFSNITDFIEWNGKTGTMNFKSSDMIDKDKLPAIASVMETKEGLRIKLHDKVGALQLLGKHHGIFVEKNVTMNFEEWLKLQQEEEAMVNE